MLKTMVLSPLSKVYTAATDLRNHFYRQGYFSSYKVTRSVVSVGNITAGGTGKTPVIDFLLDWAESSKLKVGVVSRGYKGAFDGVQKVSPDQMDHYFGDEPSMLAVKHPLSPVYVGKDRVAACEELLAHESVDLILADDAFQHRRLKRDLDIVVIDLTQTACDYQILPLGLGRETLDGLARADYIVFNKANLVSEEESAAVQSLINSHLRPEVKQRPLFGTYHISGLRSLASEKAVDKETVGSWLLVSGIGRPQSFEHMVRSGEFGEVKGHLIYPDHHFYSEKDVDRILAQMQEKGAKGLLITEKDAVKLSRYDQLKPLTYSAQLSVELKGATDKLYEDIHRLAR